MKTHPLLFLDLETTGHDPLRLVNGVLVPWHEIVDIGAVLTHQENPSVLDEFSVKVRPVHRERCLPGLVNHYPERAARGEWDNAVALPDAIRQLFGFLRNQGAVSVSGGQNFFFDWSFLVVAFAQCGIPEGEWSRSLHYTHFDIRSMAWQELLDPGETYDPDEFSLRNGRLLARLGLEPEPAVHEAINGARKSLECYKRLKELKRARKQS